MALLPLRRKIRGQSAREGSDMLCSRPYLSAMNSALTIVLHSRVNSFQDIFTSMTTKPLTRARRGFMKTKAAAIVVFLAALSCAPFASAHPASALVIDQQ